jgi:hypothetical protein
LIAVHPLKTPGENRIEIYNEFTIYMCSNIMAVFLNVAMPTDLRLLLGWVLMGFAALNIFVNLAITVYGSIKEMLSERKHKKYTKRAEKAMQIKLENRQKLMKQFPEKFKHF